MPSLKTIRKRIVSVKSTQKITRAMKMVAGARLTRAQQRILAPLPAADRPRFMQMLKTLVDGNNEASRAPAIAAATAISE